MQKHIRRGEVEDAGRMAAEMFRLSPGGFKKRLAVIVCEDALEGAGLLPFATTNPVGVVAEMARRKKNKDANGVVVKIGAAVPPEDDVWFGKENALSQLVAEGNILDATRMAWGMWSRGMRDEVRGVLGKSEAGLILLDRSLQETTFKGEPVCLLAGIVLIAAGKVVLDPTFTPIDTETYPAQIEKRRAAWYGCDMHTLPGKIAFSVVKKHYNEIEEKQLKAIWFYGESARLGETVEHKIWDWEEVATKRVGMTFKELHARWAEMRPWVRDVVYWAAEKQGIEAIGA